MGEARTDRPSPDLDRLTVAQAAAALNISQDAVRKRIARGTIPHEKDDDGRVWVILDTDQDTASKVRYTDQPQSDKDALISEMRERVASLERQLESERQANSEHRRVLAAALERIPPQLEPPQNRLRVTPAPHPTGHLYRAHGKGSGGRTGATEKAMEA